MSDEALGKTPQPIVGDEPSRKTKKKGSVLVHSRTGSTVINKLDLEKASISTEEFDAPAPAPALSVEEKDVTPASAPARAKPMEEDEGINSEERSGGGPAYGSSEAPGDIITPVVTVTAEPITFNAHQQISEDAEEESIAVEPKDKAPEMKQPVARKLFEESEAISPVRRNSSRAALQSTSLLQQLLTPRAKNESGKKLIEDVVVYIGQAPDAQRLFSFAAEENTLVFNKMFSIQEVPELLDRITEASKQSQRMQNELKRICIQLNSPDNVVLEIKILNEGKKNYTLIYDSSKITVSTVERNFKNPLEIYLNTEIQLRKPEEIMVTPYSTPQKPTAVTPRLQELFSPGPTGDGGTADFEFELDEDSSTFDLSFTRIKNHGVEVSQDSEVPTGNNNNTDIHIKINDDVTPGPFLLTYNRNKGLIQYRPTVTDFSQLFNILENALQEDKKNGQSAQISTCLISIKIQVLDQYATLAFVFDKTFQELNATLWYHPGRMTEKVAELLLQKPIESSIQQEMQKKLSQAQEEDAASDAIDFHIRLCPFNEDVYEPLVSANELFQDEEPLRCTTPAKTTHSGPNTPRHPTTPRNPLTTEFPIFLPPKAPQPVLEYPDFSNRSILELNTPPLLRQLEIEYAKVKIQHLKEKHRFNNFKPRIPTNTLSLKFITDLRKYLKANKPFFLAFWFRTKKAKAYRSLEQQLHIAEINWVHARTQKLSASPDEPKLAVLNNQKAGDKKITKHIITQDEKAHFASKKSLTTFLKNKNGFNLCWGNSGKRKEYFATYDNIPEPAGEYDKLKFDLARHSLATARVKASLSH